MSYTTFNRMLHRTAWRVPDETFVYWTDRDRSVTYAQGVELVDRVAGALYELGVVKGDRVGIFAHNGLDYVLAMFGAWRLGAISTHISVLQPENLVYYVHDSTPKVLIYTGDRQDVIAAVRDQMPSVQHYICYDGPREGSLAWDALLDSTLPPPPDDVDEMDAAHLSYTSGSSGAPKGALLAHGYTARATHCIAERLGLTSDDVTLGPTALSSSFHLVANLLPGAHRGAAIGVMGRWDAAMAWDEMEARGVTMVAGNPLLFADLLGVCRKRERKPRSLRMLLSGGAPVPPEMKRAFVDDLGVFVVESYGLSELGGFCGMGYPRREPEQRMFAIGPTLPDREVRIVDAEDREVPIGQPGQILIRPGVMLGYWNMPDRTADVLRGGWLHTGDMGMMDREGYISMLGRWSERIVRDSQVVFPRPMEESLLRHAAVRYACVIGSPDPVRGQVPKAIVELHASSSATAQELLEHCRTDLGIDSSPELLEIIRVMPMTPTGKIGRADLQARERDLIASRAKA
ncbi:MAG: acyl--CoA ligase [Anaerolineae bacterium]|nr:acyl--CoA ligase [Anaerolineae bacterium]